MTTQEIDMNIDGIISLDEYRNKKHYMLFEFLVKTKCDKVFQILKTTQGFGTGFGFYIWPFNPLEAMKYGVAIRKSQEDVIEYLDKEGWLDYKKIRDKKMEKEKFEQAAKIQQQINALKMIQDRVENKDGHFKVAFGVAINEQQHFCPVLDEELNKKLTEVAKEHCAKKMEELQRQFDVI